ncbi:MAG: TetR/AcrR family transcriptional regulator [Balneolaceae bacterium]|nr:TetR/AcrR family transcriptional regulator [Balneolaceae bacterium]
MKVEEINTKIEICEAAIDLYLEDAFEIPKLVKKTGKTASEIYTLFPNKQSILEFYYPSLIIRYRAMVGEIEGFETYTISEKLSNFIYTVFDMMDDRRAFVEETFHPMIGDRWTNTDFHNEVKELFKDFFTTDEHMAVSAAFLLNDYFYAFLRNQYLSLVNTWLDDESDDQVRTMALTDKLTSFIEEVVYNKVVDKGLDLMKYIFTQTGLSDDINDFTDWFSGWCSDEEVEIDIEDEEASEDQPGAAS